MRKYPFVVSPKAYEYVHTQDGLQYSSNRFPVERAREAFKMCIISIHFFSIFTYRIVGLPFLPLAFHPSIHSAATTVSYCSELSAVTAVSYCSELLH
jgi:hypothetical protein